MKTTNKISIDLYNTTRGIFYIFSMVLLLISCSDADKNGHSHGEGKRHEMQEIALRMDTTIWTEVFEVFLDYPVMLVNKKSNIAAHFTWIEGHRPIENADLRLTLIGKMDTIEIHVDNTEKAGIFLLPLEPIEAGTFEMILELKSGEFAEKIRGGQLRVYENAVAAKEALAELEEIEPEISFSKEQAWQIDFQTVRVDTGEIYDTRELVGRWMTAPGTERSLNAATSGNVMYELPGMVEGMKVHKGQVLMSISGEDMNVKNIATEANKAKARLDQAKSEYNRKSELRDLKIIPEGEFEQVKKRYEVAKANYRQLIRNYDSRGVAVRAPISGYIKSISVEHGGFATAGQALLNIGSQISSMIKALAPPESRETVSQGTKVWIVEKGRMKPVKARVVSVGKKVSPQEPLLPVFIEVSDPVDALEGSLVELQLGYSTGEKALVIPRSALLEDFGSYKVAVQTAGEAFELRSVRLGTFHGDRVAVIHGLRPGEWVVSRGAYQVKMASMAGSAPAHGHSH